MDSSCCFEEKGARTSIGTAFDMVENSFSDLGIWEWLGESELYSSWYL